MTLHLAPPSVQIRLVLVDPPPGIDFAIQHGRGNDHTCLFVQRSTGGDVCFDFSLSVANSREDGLPNFLGPFAQGPVAGRFVYVGVGTYAGQVGTPWSRRMKVPLQGITWPLIQKASTLGHCLLARVPGTGKDGGPSCATIRLLGEWQVAPRAGLHGRGADHGLHPVRSGTVTATDVR